MTASLQLVQGIKSHLRKEGITYSDLAVRVGVSVPTIKRDLSRSNFSLKRLDLICETLGLEVADLLRPPEPNALTMLADAQEEALIADPRLLLVTYLILNEWKFEQIIDAFRIELNQLVSLLLRLDQLRIIHYQPPKRVRKLTARNFAWRKDGPVHRYFISRVVPEFFDAAFDSPGDEFRFMGGALSQASLMRFQASLVRLASEFEQLAQHDSRLPLERRGGCSAVLALRSWEFSEFGKLRRARKPR
ncbi:MAG TPA: helix-turn-helix transcriptional regulator [Steroidobacteraceae bacterium]|nr:helix-turn-helix transcriptional regulator [Steroidobacteraceae bacterium]